MENCSLFLILTNFINENTLKIFIQSTATILSVLLSGFIASVGAAYYTKILKEVNKSIETANYAKLLAYECAANAKNYKIIAESIKNVNKDITYIIGNNLGERWSKILEYDFNKDENHQICYAMLSVLSENDIKIGDATLEDYTFYGLACKKLSIDIDDNYFVNSGETSLGIELGFTMLNDAGEIMGYSDYEILRIIV